MPSVPAELTIGELSQRSGVPASALRFYEREGLIHSRRTPGNQRRYHRTTLRRVAFIRASQAVGIPLATIGEMLAHLPVNKPPTRAFWVRAAQRWQETLDERIAMLEVLRDRFTRCIGCGCLSFAECGLVNTADKLAGQGPGPACSTKSAPRSHDHGPFGAHSVASGP